MRAIAILLLVALLATVVLSFRPAVTPSKVDAIRKHHWARRPHHGPHHHHRRLPKERLEKLKEKLQKKQTEVEALSEKIDLACTFECGAYHLCRIQGSGDTCTKPSGCVCNKFAF